MTSLKNLKNPKSPFLSSETKLRFTQRFLRSLARVRSRARDKLVPPDSEEVSTRIKTSSYACMAGAVGTRRAWSRAVIFKLRRKRATCRSLKRKKLSSHRRGAGKRRPSRSREGKLRELVPGGGEMDTCRLLDETAHYVKCLAIQVEVMRSIADRLSAN